MQTCYNCGKQVPDQTLICPDCGALVRRYTAPPSKTVLGEEELPAERQAPPVPQPFVPQSYQQQTDPPSGQTYVRPRTAVYHTPDGRTKFATALKVWLILCLVYAGYTMLSYLCMFVIYHNQDLYAPIFAQLTAFPDLTELYTLMMESIGDYYGLYLALTAACAVKFAGLLWLLIGKRRAAFYVSLGGAAVQTALYLFSGYGISAFAFCMDVVVVFVFLRKSFRELK